MAKSMRQKSSLVLKLACLSLGLPLLWAGNGWSKTCSQQEISPQIGKLAKSGDAQKQAINVLSQCGASAVPNLIWTLKESKYPQVRQGAADALVEIGAPAVADLTKVWNDQTQKQDVRIAAIEVLGRIAQKHDSHKTKIVEVLTQKLKDLREDDSIRVSAASALAEIGPKAGKSALDLRGILKERGEPEKVRVATVEALGQVNPEDKDTLAALIEVLQDKNEPWKLRNSVANTLGKMGVAARGAIPALTQVLKDNNWKTQPEAWKFHKAAIDALGKIAASHQDKAKTLKPEELQDVKTKLTDAQKVLKSFKDELQKTPPSGGELANSRERDEFAQDAIALISRPLDTIDLELENRRNRPIEWIRQNQSLAAGISISAVLVVLYLGVLWLRPQWLLMLPTELEIPKIGKIPVGVLRWLKYQPRVLDRWVSDNLDEVSKNLDKRETVTERSVYIPIHVTLGEKPINKLTGKDLKPIFRQKDRLLIVGEGGSGKTSLACQIAKWSMWLKKKDNKERRPALIEDDQDVYQHPLLPVLIEQELDINDEKTLMKAIREQLPQTAQGDFISEELLANLLRQSRVLVIVDHVSEMSEGTYKQIQKFLSESPINALVMTSRLASKDLGVVNKTLLKTLQIKGDKLSEFMDAYLKHKEKRDIFADDEEYFEACRSLSRMVSIRNVTVLLAKMYVEQIIEAKEKGIILSDNIPDLMLSYLNRLNSVEKANQRENLKVHRDAQAVAWKCLEQTYRPAPANLDEILKALNPNDKEDAKASLKYLEDRLRLVQTDDTGHKIRFALDPLAEYLAGLHLVEQYGNDEAKWKEFLAEADKKEGAPETIKGFLLAVRDCYLAKQKGAKIEDFAPKELGIKANLDPEEVKKIQRKQRIHKIIDDLSAPELNYRERAVTDLIEIGPDAKAAITGLIKIFKNNTEDIKLRQRTVRALEKIEANAEVRVSAFVNVLEDRDEDVEIRKTAVRALEAMGEAAKDAVPNLLSVWENSSEDVQLRRIAAAALGPMGEPAKAQVSKLRGVLDNSNEVGPIRRGAAKALRQLGENIPTLVVKLHGETESIDFKSIDTKVEDLGNGVLLEMVQIPEGTFLMGSPDTEPERDEAEGPQHEVTITSFHLGKYPVTQAQWRVVAALPKVERDLDPDPSFFKGDDRPVECVSWYDAVEFCGRLSQKTGNLYRLPSEAEWEYACRAGTTTPFHFGEAITSDLANYNGNYTYGASPKGEYREQPTTVGSFQAANAFGLEDMHGNVWEWCADHWHKNYEGAPSDGSAWLYDNDNQYRLLRGGSWSNHPGNCRSAYRYYYHPDNRDYHIGFRVACSSAWT